MGLSLTEEIKKLQTEDAINTLAVVCEGLLNELKIKTGPQGERGPAGPQGSPGIGLEGPPADITQVVVAAKDAVRAIVAQELFASGIIDKAGNGILIQGEPGRDGRDGVSNIPGPVGPQGPAGPQGTKGDTGATGAVGLAGAMGPTGAQGPAGPIGATGPQGSAGPCGLQGEPGQGVTLAQVETLIKEIISTLGDQALRKFVALNQEIQKIANDPRYQRIHGVRAEMVGRLTECCQEIEEEPVYVVQVQAPQSLPSPILPSPPPITPTRFERALRRLGLIR